MFQDRTTRTARLWSNRELRKVAPLFTGDVVNVSGWDDRDKEGGHHKDYFTNASTYSLTNYFGVKGYQGKENEYLLDLTGELPEELREGFYVVFNHTTLEHIFDVRKAFANICNMSKDIVIVVVPFAQIKHEKESYKDFWRFTPTCLRNLFKENGFEVIYEAESPHKNAAIYLFFIGSRHPEQWKRLMPEYMSMNKAGNWIGYSMTSQIYRKIKKVANFVKQK